MRFRVRHWGDLCGAGSAASPAWRCPVVKSQTAPLAQTVAALQQGFRCYFRRDVMQQALSFLLHLPLSLPPLSFFLLSYSSSDLPFLPRLPPATALHPFGVRSRTRLIRSPLQACSANARAVFRRSHCSAALSSASLSTITPGCRSALEAQCLTRAPGRLGHAGLNLRVVQRGAAELGEVVLQLCAGNARTQLLHHHGHRNPRAGEHKLPRRDSRGCAHPHLEVAGATGIGSEGPGSPWRDPCSTARHRASPAGLPGATSCPAPACGGARTRHRSRAFARVSAEGPVHQGSPPHGNTTAPRNPIASSPRRGFGATAASTRLNSWCSSLASAPIKAAPAAVVRRAASERNSKM